LELDMASVFESRPGVLARVNVGGGYSQPGGSIFATPEGTEMGARMDWAGDRNCGAPVYTVANTPGEIGPLDALYKAQIGEEWTRIYGADGPRKFAASATALDQLGQFTLARQIVSQVYGES
jgi:hypothetical protein